MARYQVILAYDGTQFLGFQRQSFQKVVKGGLARTVQGEVEAALKRLGWQGDALLAAGRTDTGVHATGQVIAFDLAWGHSPQALCQALNANLPGDVAAQAAAVAADDFHPRYWATTRRYSYRIFCQPGRHPLRERYAWRVWPEINPGALQAAAALLVGTHDFTAFGTPPRPGSSPERTVRLAYWYLEVEPGSPGWCFEIEANAFLYHMVRRLVFAQVLVGQGRTTLDEIDNGLQHGWAQTPGLAPAQGLVLSEVFFAPQRQAKPESDLVSREDDCV